MTESTPHTLDPTSVDRLLTALATERNRRVLTYLRGVSERVVTLDALADYVARSHSGADQSTAERTAIDLHHTGLPKLADAGLIEYDHHQKTIACQPHPLLDAGSLNDLVELD